MKVIPVTPEYSDLANMFLAVDEASGEAAVIDPGCYLDNLKNAIADSKADVRYLLITHGHFDHILGVPHIKNEMDVISAIHEDDEICLRDPDMNLMNTFYKSPDFIPSHADMTFRDGDVIRLGETELTVMHTPGHSRGSVCFIDFASRIIFSGDTLFYSTVGRTDTLGGNPAQMDESLRRLIELEGDFTVYTGHGPQTTLGHERVRNIYIRRMNRR
ncbi:MAG: MBL fold metallo-hydrolase [Clostridia bacterium]|nr:MBL fold metallo-hydrolase [Clostridia bacterium]